LKKKGNQYAGEKGLSQKRTTSPTKGTKEKSRALLFSNARLSNLTATCEEKKPAGESGGRGVS